MRTRMMLGGLVAALVVGACGRGTPEPSASPVALTPAPDIEATVVAEVQARLRSTQALAPSAAPASAETIDSVLAFATSHRQLVGDWEEFHTRFDLWRNGNTPCDASSVEVTLRVFAATIGEIAARARALPRDPSVRELADKLITSSGPCASSGTAGGLTMRRYSRARIPSAPPPCLSRGTSRTPYSTCKSAQPPHIARASMSISARSKTSAPTGTAFAGATMHFGPRSPI